VVRPHFHPPVPPPNRPAPGPCDAKAWTRYYQGKIDSFAYNFGGPTFRKRDGGSPHYNEDYWLDGAEPPPLEDAPTDED
jgi:hypothetical protein